MADEASREEARQARARSLIASLNTFTQEGGGERPPRRGETFLLDTTVAGLLEWLRLETQGIERRKFPSGAGYFALQQARQHKQNPGEAQSITGNTVILTMDGMYHEETEGVLLHLRLISFTVTPLDRGGVAVQAKCTHAALMDYYGELLDGIARHWAN